MTNDELSSNSGITHLNAASEEIFQLHKRHIIVNWTKETLQNIDPSIRVQAMNLLEDQKIIFKPNPTDSSITQINPVVTSASSYDDAFSIIKEKGGVAPTITPPIMKDGSHIEILEPPKKKKSRTLWIVIATIVILFLLFEFVPFYKWL